MQDALAAATPAERALLQAAVQRGLVRHDQLEAAARVAARGGGLLAALRAGVLSPGEREQLELFARSAGPSASGQAPGMGATVLDRPSGRVPPPSHASGRQSPQVAQTLASPPPRPSGRLDEPARIGPYAIERPLGRGGMGVVYVAVHPSLGRRVALKLLPRDASPEAGERFLFEAQAAARLKHPNIVGVLEVGASEGQRWLAMDLIEGRTLHGRVEKEGPLPEREAATILEKLSRAVAFAHARSILHRDIKPHNVLLDAQGEPFLADFGLAKEISEQGARGVTVSGQMLGTPAYMPPEQAGGQLDLVDRRADVYSLGATLYEALTGHPPFEGESAINVIAKLLSQDPVRPTRLRPDLDRDLETVCLKCLEKAPDARYRSADALAQDLARWLAGEPIEARPVGLAERLRRRVRRNPAVSGIVGAAALGLLVTWGILGQRADYALADAVVARRDALEAANSADTAKEQALEAAQGARVVALLERAYGMLGVDRPAEAEELFKAAGEQADRKPADPSGRRAELGLAAARGLHASRRAREPRARLGEHVLAAAVIDPRTAIAVERGGLVRLDLEGEGRSAATVLSRLNDAGWVSGLVVSPDGALAVAGVRFGDSGPAIPVAWDVRAGAELWRRPDLDAYSIASSSDATSLAMGTRDGVLLLDPATGETRVVLRSQERSGAAYEAAATAVRFIDNAPGSSPRAILLVAWADGLFDYLDGATLRGIHTMNLRRASAFIQTVHAVRRRELGPTPLIVGEQAGGVSIHDMTSGVVTIVAKGEAGRAQAGHVVRSPDGTLLAVLFADGTTRVWRLDDDDPRLAVGRFEMGPREVRSIRSQPDLFAGCVLTPDGARVLLWGGDPLEVWDATDARLVGVGPAAAARDGRLLRRVASAQRAMRLGPTESDPALDITPAAIGGPENECPLYVTAASFGPGDRQAFVALMERNTKDRRTGIPGLYELQRFDLISGTRSVQSLPRTAGALAPMPGGDVVVGLERAEGGSYQGEVLLASGPELASTRKLGAHGDSVRGAAVLPGGRDVVTAGEDGTVIVWPAASAEGALVFWPAREEPAQALTPADTAGTSDRYLRLLNGVFALGVSPDGRRLAVGTGDGTVRLFDLPAGPAGTWSAGSVRFQGRLDGHRHQVVACAFLPDGQRLASVSRDGVVRVWDLALGRSLRRTEVPSRVATGAALAADGKSLHVWSEGELFQVELRVD